MIIFRTVMNWVDGEGWEVDPIYNNCIKKLHNSGKRLRHEDWLQQKGYKVIQSSIIDKSTGQSVYIPTLEFETEQDYLRFILEFS
jgi:hypothetical protein